VILGVHAFGPFPPAHLAIDKTCWSPLVYTGVLALTAPITQAADVPHRHLLGPKPCTGGNTSCTAADGSSVCLNTKKDDANCGR
jgi:hypothetical protein